MATLAELRTRTRPRAPRRLVIPGERCGLPATKPAKLPLSDSNGSVVLPRPENPFPNSLKRSASAERRHTGTCTREQPSTGVEAAVNLTELGAALGPLFDIPGSPSHHQLRDAFVRRPRSSRPGTGGKTSNGSHLGKMKRIRQVFASPAAHGDCRAAGPRTCGAVSGRTGFNPDSRLCRQWESGPARPGLRSRSASLSNPTAPHGRPDHRQPQRYRTAVTLRSYVDRIKPSPDDAPLQVGAENSTKPPPATF